MLPIVIFAVNARDAQLQCEELGVDFDQVVWVMNPALLGEMDVSGHQPYATPMFRQMPAFIDAKRRFPELPDQPGDRKPIDPGRP